MEHGVHCKIPICEFRESWDTEDAAKAAAVWHIYEDHREIWNQIIGERAPTDIRPEDLGRKFEAWESQL